MLINGCLTDSFENLSPYPRDYKFDCGEATIVTPLSCNNVESLAVFRILKSSPFDHIINITEVDHIYELPYLNRHYTIDSHTRKLRLPNGSQINDQIYITSVSNTEAEFYILGSNIEKNGVYVNSLESTVGLRWDGTVWKVSYWGKILQLPTVQQYISKVTYYDGQTSNASYDMILRLYGYSDSLLILKDEPADPDSTDDEIDVPSLGLQTEVEHGVLKWTGSTLVVGPVTASTTLETLPDDPRFKYYKFFVTYGAESTNLELTLDTISPWFRLENRPLSIFYMPQDYMFVRGYQLSFIDQATQLRDPLNLRTQETNSIFWIKTLSGVSLFSQTDYVISSGKVHPTEDGRIFNNQAIIVHYA